MAKRYLIVVPVNKDAYLKGFDSMDKAGAIIQSKVGTFVDQHEVDAFERPMLMLSQHVRKTNKLQVNDRATFYAELPSAEDDIFGTAVIIGRNDGYFAGLTEEVALKAMNEINETRIS